MSVASQNHREFATAVTEPPEGYIEDISDSTIPFCK
jgi:hypothetical protein